MIEKTEFGDPLSVVTLGCSCNCIGNCPNCNCWFNSQGLHQNMTLNYSQKDHGAVDLATP